MNPNSFSLVKYALVISARERSLRVRVHYTPNRILPA